MDFQIDYDQLYDLGRELQNKANDFQNLINQIDKINEELNNAWHDESSKEYFQKVNAEKDSMQKLADTILTAGEIIVETSNTYLTTKEEIMKGISD